jgi:hypothetical protein
MPETSSDNIIEMHANESKERMADRRKKIAKRFTTHWVLPAAGTVIALHLLNKHLEETEKNDQDN